MMRFRPNSIDKVRDMKCTYAFVCWRNLPETSSKKIGSMDIYQIHTHRILNLVVIRPKEGKVRQEMINGQFYFVII